MKRTTLTLAAVALSATALVSPALAGPSQLELQVGIDAADYGKFSNAQLAQVKSIVESDLGTVDMSNRIDAILNPSANGVAATRGASGLTLAQEAQIHSFQSIDNQVEREARIAAVVNGPSSTTDTIAVAQLLDFDSIDNKVEREARIEAVLN